MWLCFAVCWFGLIGLICGLGVFTIGYSFFCMGFVGLGVDFVDLLCFDCSAGMILTWCLTFVFA